jgi:hypothetical protein
LVNRRHDDLPGDLQFGSQRRREQGPDYREGCICLPMLSCMPQCFAKAQSSIQNRLTALTEWLPDMGHVSSAWMDLWK